MLKAWFVVLIILLNTVPVRADVSTLTVLGLFNGMAVLNINDQQRILKTGKTSPEGVTLISANAKQAVLEIDGIQETYYLASHIGSRYIAPAKPPAYSIWAKNGLYTTPGSINGFNVDFIVDTGASAIAINSKTADRLGLNYQSGEVVGVKTAASVEKAYRVNLSLVQVGQIKLHNVSALVLEGEQPQRALLGMSFLGQLEIQQSGDKMELKQPF